MMPANRNIFDLHVIGENLNWFFAMHIDGVRYSTLTVIVHSKSKDLARFYMIKLRKCIPVKNKEWNLPAATCFKGSSK